MGNERIKDQQIVNLSGTGEPVVGIEIEFPAGYTDDDMDAIWNAIKQVQVARKLVTPDGRA